MVWYLVPALAVWLALVFLVTHHDQWARLQGMHAWRWVEWPPFHDQSVIYTAWDGAARGIDPLADRHYAFNYPRVWLAGRWLGLPMIPQVASGLLLAAGFLGAAAWVVAGRSFFAALTGALLVMSPPVIMAVERGNNDLIIFLLVLGAGLTLVGSRGWMRDGLAVGMLLLAGLLKYYPGVILAGGIGATAGKRRIHFVAALAALVVCLGAAPDEIRDIAIKTERGDIFSFGCNALAVRLASKDLDVKWRPSFLRDNARAMKLASLAAYLLVLTAAAWLGWCRRRRCPSFARRISP